MQKSSSPELMAQLLPQDSPQLLVQDSLNDMSQLVPIDPAEAKLRDLEDVDDDLGEVHGVPVDPWCKGTLDYPALEDPPYESCICGSPTLPSFFYKKRFGNAYLCCQTKSKRPRVICMCGAGWGTMLITYTLLFGTSGAVFIFAFYAGIKLYISIPCFAVWLLTFIVLGRTSFGDPGIYPHYAKPKSSDWRYCTQTGSFRPPQQNIKYCSDSGMLIENIDHFCPWTGTTIAGGNLCFFQAFLGMSMLTIIASCVSGYMALIDLEKIFPSLLNSTWGGTKV